MSDLLSTEVSAHDKLAYHDNVRQAIQQGTSKLSKYTHDLDFKGKKASYDDIGTADPQERQGKYADTKFQNIDHYRRWMACKLWDWAELITEEDKLATISDPTNAYVIAANKGFQRLKDKVIIKAMFADVEVGEEGGYIRPWDADHAIILEDGGTGLTLDKLQLLAEHIQYSDVDEETQFNIGLTPAQGTNLLNTTEIKNIDYNNVKALVDGKVDTFMGFNFVRGNRYLWHNDDISSGIRRLPVWASEGIGLAIPKDLKVKIDPRADKNYLNQIWCSMNLGALRRDEKLVMEVRCQETMINRPVNL